VADHLSVPSTSGSTSTQRASSLAPAPGVTPAPTQAHPHRFLSDVIVERRLVEPAAMRIAMQASLTGRSLTEILLANRDLDEDDLAHTLAEHHGLDHVDLDVFAIDREAVALVEPGAARRLGAVPIAFLASGAVVVALHEPNGSTAAVELARLMNRRIQPAVASRSQIEALIDALPARGRSRSAVSQRDVSSSPSDREDDGAGARPNRVPATAPGDDARPPGTASPSQGVRGTIARREQLEDELESWRRQAQVAERARRDAEQRARASHEIARDAQAGAGAAEVRVEAAEERAAAAEQLAGAAEARAAEVASAAVDANEGLTRLLHACDVLERDAHARGLQIAALRAELDAERGVRVRLEQQLRRAQAASEVALLRARIADLEHEIAARRALGGASAHVARGLRQMLDGGRRRGA
jgi:Type II secretion system (T2SS), protein E, N-terminal domain